MERIVDKLVLELESQLGDKGVKIVLTKAARTHLAEVGYEPENGARPMARVLRTRVAEPLSEEILYGRLEGGGTAHIQLVDGELAFDFELPSEPDVASEDESRQQDVASCH